MMERVDIMLEPLRAFMAQIGAMLPRIVLAIVILLVGWFLAKAASFAVRKALRTINFHIVTKRAGMDSFLERGGTSVDSVDLFGALAYWLVILAVLIVAFNGLGLNYVTELLTRVLFFLPRLFLALLILALGAYFARFVGNAVIAYCRSIGIPDAGLLAGIARYAILVFVVMIAVDQLDFGGAILRTTFLIVLGGVMLAFALAFGLGGREWAAAHLERWWPASRSELPRAERTTPREHR
jgi:hypothetical protein